MEDFSLIHQGDIISGIDFLFIRGISSYFSISGCFWKLYHWLCLKRGNWLILFKVLNDAPFMECSLDSQVEHGLAYKPVVKLLLFPVANIFTFFLLSPIYGHADNAIANLSPAPSTESFSWRWGPGDCWVEWLFVCPSWRNHVNRMHQ